MQQNIKHQLKKCIIIIFYFNFIPIAQANDTAFGGSGASPYPIHEDNIKMLSEHIQISGFDLNHNSLQGGWRYHCSFVFRNESKKPLDILMGFPLPIYEEYGEIALPKGKTIQKGEPLVHDFTTEVNGTPVKVKLQAISKSVTEDVSYKKAYLWNMTFPPLTTKYVTHHYITGATFDVMGYHWVHYVLKTGAMWKSGHIGHTRLQVTPNTPTRLCSEIKMDADYLKPKPKGIKINGSGKKRRYILDITNYHPKEDLSLCIQTGRNYVRYQLIYPLLSQSGSSILNKMNTEQLRILRNTVYAQYGRQFKTKKLQNYFNQQWWYEINSDYSDQLLTKEDNKAISIIKKWEAEKK